MDLIRPIWFYQKFRERGGGEVVNSFLNNVKKSASLVQDGFPMGISHIASIFFMLNFNVLRLLAFFATSVGRI